MLMFLKGQDRAVGFRIEIKGGSYQLNTETFSKIFKSFSDKFGEPKYYPEDNYYMWLLTNGDEKMAITLKLSGNSIVWSGFQ